MEGPYSRSRGKRSYPHYDREYTDHDDRYKRHMHVDPRNKPSPLLSAVPVPGDTVFRIVCPEVKVGSVIGKGGSIIKSLRHETGAKIMIADAVPGSDDRVILIADSRRERDGSRDRGRDQHKGSSYYDAENGRESDSTDKDDWKGNARGEKEEFISSSQEALIKIHSRMVEVFDGPDMKEEEPSDTITTRLLVPTGQVGCLLGRRGKIIQQIRDETKSQIRILPRDQLPQLCTMEDDEIVQIVGSIDAVKKALRIVSTRLYENPPRGQGQGQGHFSGPPHSPVHRMFPPEEAFPSHRDPYGALGGIDGQFRTYSPTAADIETGGGGNLGRSHRSTVAEDMWRVAVFGVVGENFGRRSHGPENALSDVAWQAPGFGVTGGSSSHPHGPASMQMDEGWQASGLNEELVFRILCPNDKIGSIIGRGGSIIRDLEEDIGARIEVIDAVSGSDERVIAISSPEHPDDNISPAQEALLHVQSKIADLGPDEDAVITSRLLVPSHQVGCLLGKGGSIISEMRKLTHANIRILSKSDLPKCALANEELVQIVGDIRVAREALIQVTKRLRAHVYHERSLPNPGAEGSPMNTRNHERGSPGRFDFLDHEAKNISRLPGSYVPFPSSPGHWPRKDIFGGRSFAQYESPSFQGSDLFSTTGALVTKTTVEVVLPSRLVSSIIVDNDKITHIHQMSGAKVKLLDAMPGAPGRTVEISGTPEQTKAAQNLLQALILSRHPSAGFMD